jgi:hypothetical protein
MARSDDRKDGKRGPSRPKPASSSRKETAARPPRSEPAPAPRKTAAPPKARRSADVKKSEPTEKARTVKPSTAKPTTAKPAARAAAASSDRAAAGRSKPSSSAKVPARTTAPQAKATAPQAKATAPRAKAAAPRAKAARKEVPRANAVPPMLEEEERIEDAKYQPRELPPRLFEEERFIFPESYGQSRIRLLVKDPEWLFAHWDVDPQSLADLRAELGERASALSRLTLRVSDPQHGGESRVLLPDGSRSWYVRADSTERSYRAELGLTLPSGEFRSLAESNTVRTPRSGPAPGAAPRRARYDGAEPPAAGATAAEPEPAALAPTAAAAAASPGPWKPDPSASSYPGPTSANPPADARKPGRRGDPGGASDVYRR